MQLPGAENTVVEPRKLRGYLLSPSHPVGRFKAAFFALLGYTQDDWGLLAEDLRRHALEGEASEEASDYGHKFEVRGDLVGPADRTQVITIASGVRLAWWGPSRRSPIDDELFIRKAKGGRIWD